MREKTTNKVDIQSFDTCFNSMKYLVGNWLDAPLPVPTRDLSSVVKSGESELITDYQAKGWLTAGHIYTSADNAKVFNYV